MTQQIPSPIPSLSDYVTSDYVKPDRDESDQQNSDRKALRQRLRQQRRALTASQQRKAAQQLKQQFARAPWFHRAKHIALYLANDGEVDLEPLLKLLTQQKKTAYLPIVDARKPQQMLFAPYCSDTPLKANRFGIKEPQVSKRLWREAKQLDLVIAPLVGFDDHGGRLGMGGGFYDRTLRFLKQRNHWHKPHFIGAAHHFQQVDNLPMAHWDIPLEAVVTDAGMVIPTILPD